MQKSILYNNTLRKYKQLIIVRIQLDHGDYFELAARCLDFQFLLLGRRVWMKFFNRFFINKLLTNIVAHNSGL